MKITNTFTELGKLILSITLIAAILYLLYLGKNYEEISLDEPTHVLRDMERLAASLPVFPGAEGFGSTTVAGSGRHINPPTTTVFLVNTLNDSGVGSLRFCMEAKVPRTCLFEIGGVI